MNLKEIRTTRHWVYVSLHVIILLLSIFLIVSISYDTFNNIPFYEHPLFMKVQLWICIFFLADFFIELFMSPRKGRYILSHLAFFFVSIPYLSIVDYFGWHFSAEVTYLLRFMPLIRGGYAMAIVVGWFTTDRTASAFVTYLLSLVAMIYFGAMVFYVVEHNVNPGVENFGDAIWWASMDSTTEGSNIIAVTPIGRVLSFVLACVGLMMLPLFTVYLQSLLKNRHNIFSTHGGPAEQNGNTTPTKRDPDDGTNISDSN